MAVAIAERLKNPVNLDPLLTTIRGLARMDQKPAALPWTSIWNSSIPHQVINRTAGLYFSYEEALYYPITPQQNPAIGTWREQTRRALLQQLHQNPQSKAVLESMKQSHMAKIEVRETLAEKLRMLASDLGYTANGIAANLRGRESIMKGGAY